ncbi:unnamed protein product, partial [Discosporangium mesarthrocarpum]
MDAGAFTSAARAARAKPLDSPMVSFRRKHSNRDNHPDGDSFGERYGSGRATAGVRRSRVPNDAWVPLRRSSPDESGFPGLLPGGQSPVSRRPRDGEKRETRRRGEGEEKSSFRASSTRLMPGLNRGRRSSEQLRGSSSTIEGGNLGLASSSPSLWGSAVGLGDADLAASRSSVPPVPSTNGLLGTEATAALLSHLADLRSLCKRQRIASNSLRGALVRKQGELERAAADVAWVRSELSFITGDMLGALQSHPVARTIFHVLSERVCGDLGAEAAGIYVEVDGGDLWLLPSGPVASGEVLLGRGEGAVGLVAAGATPRGDWDGGALGCSAVAEEGLSG